MIVWWPPLPCTHAETGLMWWLPFPWACTAYPDTAAVLIIPPQGCPGCSRTSYSLQKPRSTLASLSDRCDTLLLHRSVDQPVIKHQFLHEKGLRTELLCETRLVPCSAESFTVDSVISLCHLCFNSVNVSLRPLPTANQKPHNLDCFFLVWSAVLVLWLHWGLATCYTTVSIYLSPASSVCKEKSCFPKFF